MNLVAPTAGRCSEDGTYDYAPPSADEDGDEVPDEVERQLCARRAVADAINAAEGAGRCDEEAPYGYSAPFIVDGDGDQVPDAVEPVLCSLESRDQGLDGGCSGDDYRPLQA